MLINSHTAAFHWQGRENTGLLLFHPKSPSLHAAGPQCPLGSDSAFHPQTLLSQCLPALTPSQLLIPHEWVSAHSNISRGCLSFHCSVFA